MSSGLLAAVFCFGAISAYASEGVQKIRSSNDAKVFSSGERYFPVMLVETADFKALDSAFFWRLFNEDGFKENGAYGSVRDYFVESSDGQFKPTYDIYPIKLPKNFSSYNNDSLLILPSIDQLVERADFKARASKYEKEIAFVILHPAAKDTAEKFNSKFFNHCYELRYSANRVYSKNGYKFNHYAFVAQKKEKKTFSTSTKDADMLGAYIHEFSHVIGLSDTYGTDSQGYATIGPLPYDVMALALRNGNGGYPPTFSAFEREAVGWLTPIEITNPDSVYVLHNLSKMQAYAVSNPNHPNEYYLIEYRPAVGFDSKIGSSSYSGKQGKNGVLIWYVDFDSYVFANNKPNSNLNHQRIEVRSVLSQNKESFTDFSFVNKSGKAKINGLFNLVFDGNDRVCFTVNKSKTLDKCPDEISSSSALAEESSSSADMPKSSSSQSSSSVSSKNSSSSRTDALLTTVAVPKIQMRVSGGALDIKAPMQGEKTVRFYDALGNAIGEVSFKEPFASIDISKWNSSVFVRLDVNGKMLLAKRVMLR